MPTKNRQDLFTALPHREGKRKQTRTARVLEGLPRGVSCTLALPGGHAPMLLLLLSPGVSRSPVGSAAKLGKVLVARGGSLHGAGGEQRQSHPAVPVE